MRRRLSDEEFNALSVRLELQADFFAGVWAHHAQAAKQILEAGDVEEALAAASAIGDDRLQMESRGYVVPESFTHGTSEQRLRWFRKGLESGDVRVEERGPISLRDVAARGDEKDRRAQHHGLSGAARRPSPGATREGAV